MADVVTEVLQYAKQSLAVAILEEDAVQPAVGAAFWYSSAVVDTGSHCWPAGVKAVKPVVPEAQVVDAIPAAYVYKIVDVRRVILYILNYIDYFHDLAVLLKRPSLYIFQKIY